MSIKTLRLPNTPQPGQIPQWNGSKYIATYLTFPTFNPENSYLIKKVGADTVAYLNNALIFSGSDSATVINTTINAIRPFGGVISFGLGVFNLSQPLNLGGTGGFESPYIRIQGHGIGVTIFKLNINIDACILKDAARVGISDITFDLQGASNGLLSQVTTLGPASIRAFWQSEFKNIQFLGASNHTAYAMKFDNPFRSYFENISIVGCCNSLLMNNVNSSFNSGDCTFVRNTWDNYANLTAGIGVELRSTGGNMNQNLFNDLILFGGSDLPYPQSRWTTGIKIGPNSDRNTFNSLNIELASVAVDIDNASGNFFECTYMLATNTFFKFRNGVRRTIVAARYLALNSGVKLIDDSSSGGRNIFRDTTVTETTALPSQIIKTSNTSFENVWDENAGVFLT